MASCWVEWSRRGYWDLAGSTGRPEKVTAWKAEQMVAGEVSTRGRDKDERSRSQKHQRAKKKKKTTGVSHTLETRDRSGTGVVDCSGCCRGSPPEHTH